MLPESPVPVLRLSIHEHDLSARNTTNGSVKTVPHTSVKISCIETLKVGIKRHKTLQSVKTIDRLINS